MYLQLQILGRHLPATIHAASAATWIVLQRPHRKEYKGDPLWANTSQERSWKLHGNYQIWQWNATKTAERPCSNINHHQYHQSEDPEKLPDYIMPFCEAMKGVLGGSYGTPDGFSTKHLFWVPPWLWKLWISRMVVIVDSENQPEATRSSAIQQFNAIQRLWLPSQIYDISKICSNCILLMVMLIEINLWDVKPLMSKMLKPGDMPGSQQSASWLRKGQCQLWSAARWCNWFFSRFKLPSGYICQNSYWKSPFIVDFPIENGDVPSFFVNVYQRVWCSERFSIPTFGLRWWWLIWNIFRKRTYPAWWTFTKSNGKWPLLMGKSTINGHFPLLCECSPEGKKGRMVRVWNSWMVSFLDSCRILQRTPVDTASDHFFCRLWHAGFRRQKMDLGVSENVVYP